MIVMTPLATRVCPRRPDGLLGSSASNASARASYARHAAGRAVSRLDAPQQRQRAGVVRATMYEVPSGPASRLRIGDGDEPARGDFPATPAQRLRICEVAPPGAACPRPVPVASARASYARRQVLPFTPASRLRIGDNDDPYVPPAHVSWPPSTAVLVRRRQQRAVRLARMRRELGAARRAGLELRHADKLARTGRGTP